MVLLDTRLPEMGLKPRLQQALNKRMNRLGAATTGLGLFSVALVAAGKLWLACAWCFCQVWKNGVFCLCLVDFTVGWCAPGQCFRWHYRCFLKSRCIRPWINYF